MLKWELRKILFKNKGMLVILVAIFINACIYLGQSGDISPNVSTDTYMAYINQYQGKLNQAKEKSIESEYDKISNSRKYIEQLQSQYKEGKISESQLQKQSEVYIKKKENATSFRYFYNQYQTAKKDETHCYLLNTKGWDVLFNDSITPILLLLIAICICIPNFSKEYEREMDQLLLCCENGRTKQFLIKIVAAILILMLSALFIHTLDIIIALFKYNLSGFSYPLQSITIFNGSHFSFNLLSAYMFSILLQLIGVIFVCVFSSFISIALKNQIISCITTLLVNMFPFVVFMGTMVFLILPIPGNLLFSSVYLKGDQYQENLVSFNHVVKEKQFSGFTEHKLIFLLVIVIMIIAILLILSRFIYLQKKIPHTSRKMLLCFLIPLLLSGCSSNIVRNTNFSYDGWLQTEASVGKDKLRIADNYKQILLEKDGVQVNLIKDPLFDEHIECIFAHNNVCYYAYHVRGVLCFAKVDLRTYANTRVYHSSEINQQDFFGTVNQKDEEEKLDYLSPNVTNMFCDSEYIYYFLMDGSFHAINLHTQKQTQISSNCLAGNSNYYYYGNIYYINTLNQLVCYNTKSMKERILPHVYVDSFKIVNNAIVYTDLFSSENKKIQLTENER